KYLYFLSSTDYGPRTGWLEMSSLDRPVRRAIYLAVLSAHDPSPLLPETGDEPKPSPNEPRGNADTSKKEPVRIDFERIGQRILALNVPASDYSTLIAGAAGTIFYMEPVSSNPGAPLRLQKYQLKDRAAAPFLEGIRSFTLSGDKKKLLYHSAGAR